ncbi:hypothetical protein DBW_2251 [Desulfuromonas sp. DDH964]|nr:hypothetical protein DBW_2251 [Desulfuromonas sp. DDH964]
MVMRERILRWLPFFLTAYLLGEWLVSLLHE